MKYLLFIPVLGLVCASMSCRTMSPLDPMTMKPSTKCLPADAQSASVYGTK
ncbi:MAG: hypothetical protein ACQCXQ_05210 [Verrucomicrobiales bacterium]|nr:hypothetical protein [Verrucomicrobiota bacterium JB025]